MKVRRSTLTATLLLARFIEGRIGETSHPDYCPFLRKTAFDPQVCPVGEANEIATPNNQDPSLTDRKSKSYVSKGRASRFTTFARSDFSHTSRPDNQPRMDPSTTSSHPSFSTYDFIPAVDNLEVILRHRYDFATFDSGARIVAAAPTLKNVRAIQVSVGRTLRRKFASLRRGPRRKHTCRLSVLTPLGLW